MNREAIVRGVRMLKIVKAGAQGLRKLHTSNKVRGNLGLSIRGTCEEFARNSGVIDSGIEASSGFSLQVPSVATIVEDLGPEGSSHDRSYGTSFRFLKIEGRSS